MECSENGQKHLPDIQITEDSETRGDGHNIELFEEIDEMGSFVEDKKVHPETIVKTHMV